MRHDLACSACASANQYQVVGVHQQETLGWPDLLKLDALAQAPLSAVAKKHKWRARIRRFLGAPSVNVVIASSRVEEASLRVRTAGSGWVKVGLTILPYGPSAAALFFRCCDARPCPHLGCWVARERAWCTNNDKNDDRAGGTVWGGQQDLV